MFLWKSQKGLSWNLRTFLIWNLVAVDTLLWYPISLNYSSCILKYWCWVMSGGYRSTDYKSYDLGSVDWRCRVISFSHVVQWIWKYCACPRVHICFLVGLAPGCIWHLDLDYFGLVNFLTRMIELGVVKWLKAYRRQFQWLVWCGRFKGVGFLTWLGYWT